MWNGGRTISKGYVLIYRPDHPFVGARGYIQEHRLVMEGLVGRYLRPEEVVHHEDDNGLNNDPSNLRLFANQAEHKAYEYKRRVKDTSGRLVKKEQVS